MKICCVPSLEKLEMSHRNGSNELSQCMFFSSAVFEDNNKVLS